MNLYLSHIDGISNGEIELPSSKSICNRILLLNKVLNLNLNIQNISNAEDSVLLNKALEQLNTDNTTFNINHAGTCMRFLCAYFSCIEGERILTGSERIKNRPIHQLVNVLRELGAEIEYLEKENFLPLKIKGKKLSGGNVKIDSSVSSQFISALILVSPLFKNGLSVELQGEVVSSTYINMSLELLKSCGFNYSWNDNLIKLTNETIENISLPINYTIETDWSSAAFIYSIVSLSKESEITIPHLQFNSLQGDKECVAIFEKLGVKTEFKEDYVELSKIEITTNYFEYDFVTCPDLAQSVACTCAGLKVNARLRGLQTLVHKETDRLKALKNELEKLNCLVEIKNGYELILNCNAIDFSKEVSIATYHDHRMAMAFAPLATKTKLIIEDKDVVVKSFPNFWTELEKLNFSLK